MDSRPLSILHLIMNYMVYVLCNRTHTIFYLGMTGGFTDGIFELEYPGSHRISCWQDCTQLVYYRKFHEFDQAACFIECLQKKIEVWDLTTIERRNEGWKDLTSEWLSPNRLLSFQVFQNSFQCFDN